MKDSGILTMITPQERKRQEVRLVSVFYCVLLELEPVLACLARAQKHAGHFLGIHFTATEISKHANVVKNLHSFLAVEKTAADQMPEEIKTG